MLIFLVSPHPDDIEFGCGGIIQKNFEADHKLYCFVNTYSPNENDVFFNDVRLKEAMTLESKNCKVYFWENININQMIGWICDLKPDVVLMPYNRDYNETHRQVQKNMEIAIERARFGERDKDAYYVPCVLYYETFSTINFMPEIIIDVTREYSNALKQLKSHELGIKILPSLPYVFQLRHQTHGVEGSCLYGEGLVVCKTQGYLWIQNTKKMLDYLISIT